MDRILLSGLFLASIAQGAYEPAFILERSTNANRLVYEADLAKPAPIHPYWEMRAQDGHPEELNSFERNNVYGTKILARDENVSFEFKGLPGIPVTLTMEDGHPRAKMFLNGEQRRVIRIFLELSGAVFPKVISIAIEHPGGKTTLVPGTQGTWREK